MSSIRFTCVGSTLGHAGIMTDGLRSNKFSSSRSIVSSHSPMTAAIPSIRILWRHCSGLYAAMLLRRKVAFFTEGEPLSLPTHQSVVELTGVVAEDAIFSSSWRAIRCSSAPEWPASANDELDSHASITAVAPTARQVQRRRGSRAPPVDSTASRPRMTDSIVGTKWPGCVGHIYLVKNALEKTQKVPWSRFTSRFTLPRSPRKDRR